MTTPASLAKLYWSAALFHRMAPGRDQANVRKVLAHVVKKSTGKVQSRAFLLLKEIENGTNSSGNGAA